MTIEQQLAAIQKHLKTLKAQANRAQAQISLFKALGGGWEGAPAVVSLPPPAR